jgi:hypothetical protein
VEQERLLTDIEVMEDLVVVAAVKLVVAAHMAVVPPQEMVA